MTMTLTRRGLIALLFVACVTHYDFSTLQHGKRWPSVASASSSPQESVKDDGPRDNHQHQFTQEAFKQTNGLKDSKISPFNPPSSPPSSRPSFSLYSVGEQLPDFIRLTDWAAIGRGIREASSASWNATKLWFRVLVLLKDPAISMIVTIGEALLPHAKAAIIFVYHFLRKQDPIVLVIGFSVLALTAFILHHGYIGRAKRRIRSGKEKVKRKYKSVLGEVQAKSRIAALSLPHFLYFIPIIVAIYAFPSVGTLLDRSGFWVYLTTIFYPILSSVWNLRSYVRCRQPGAQLPSLPVEGRVPENVSENELPPPHAKTDDGESSIRKRKATPARTKSQSAKGSKSRGKKASSAGHSSSPEEKALQRSVKYWVILSWSFIFFFIFTSALQFLPASFRPDLDRWMPGGFVIVSFGLWLQLSWTDGASIVFYLLIPVINRYVREVPLPLEGSGPNAAQRGVILNLLVTLNILTPARRDMVAEMLEHGGYLLLGFVFLFTPTFLTRIGCLLVGFGIPAYTAMKAVITNANGNLVRWVKYFVLLALFEYVHGGFSVAFGWLPLWFHLKLLPLLWLQLPYFNGAQLLYDRIVDKVVPDIRRHSTPKAITDDGKVAHNTSILQHSDAQEVNAENNQRAATSRLKID